MCLNFISDERPTPEGVGWKVFDMVGSTSTLAFQYYTRDGIMVHNPEQATVPRGQWLKAKQKRVQTFYTPVIEYKTGFHIYLDYPEIIQGVGVKVVKVKYRRARLLGEQIGRRVVVADEMYVPLEGEEI